jgi:hypothetical protein
MMNEEQDELIEDLKSIWPTEYLEHLVKEIKKEIKRRRQK